MRKLIAAVVGVLGLSSSASAQYSTAASAATTVPPGPNSVILGATPHHAAAGGYFTSRARFGDPYVNHGAGSIWSDHSFMFGSSRTFMAPCGPYIPAPRPSIFGRKSDKCDKPAPREYGSYANH